MAVDGTPRRTVETDPMAQVMALITNVRDRVSSLERGSNLQNATISGGAGLTVIDSTGQIRFSLTTSPGSAVAYNGTGNPVAQFGPLTHSAPGQYGVEVLVGGTWVQLGAQVATWSNLAGIPSQFNPATGLWQPAPHTHAGTDITSRVASATDVIGSQSGFNNTVTGTSFVAAWLGNDGNFSFGRNTSSIQYKQNVRSHRVDPAQVLKIDPVLYDRIPTPPGVAPTNEYGVIAEQVHEHVPELVTWFDGQIDSVRYDLLSVALLSVVKDQNARIAALEAQMKTLVPTYTPPAAVSDPAVPASGAPVPEPAPLPYTIQGAPS